MKEEINHAARVVADMAVTKVPPLTVPVGSLASIPKGGKMTRGVYKQGRRTQVYDLLLGAQGLSALALTMKLQRMWPDWKMQNTYNTMHYMSRRDEAKKLNGLWYAGETNPSGARGRGRPRTNGVHREAVQPTIIRIEQAPLSGEFDFDAALRLIEGALQAARNIVLQAKNSALDKKQQHARLEAILKLARNQE